MTRLLFLLFLILAFSCSPPDKVSSSVFYDIDSIINVQVGELTRGGFKLEKRASIGKGTESVVITPDSTAWSNELAVFRQIELAERPVNRDKYKVSDEDDTRSNLRVKAYTAKETPVPYVRYYYLRTIEDIRKIEASYYETNLLYTSRRDLTLEFEENSGTTVLTRYRIDGYQKLMMSDSVHFLVEGDIIF